MKLVKKKLVKHLIFLFYRNMNIIVDRYLKNVSLNIQRPQIVEIELTNHCNLHCKHCHRKAMKRPLGYMELNVFKKLIDELINYPIAFLRIIGLGESPLHPDFSEMIQYASNKGLKIEIATNGKIFERFMDSEILSWDIDILGISVDGVDKDSYEEIRIGGNYNNIKHNIERFYQYKTQTRIRHPLVVIRKVIMPCDKKEELQRFISTWKYTSDMITFNTLSEIDNSLHFEHKSSYKCKEFYYTAHIRYDGSVILCPNKFIFDKNDVIGNIKSDELKQIWKSDKLVEIRKLHKKKLYPDYCKNCFKAFDSQKSNANSKEYNFSNNYFENKLNKYIKVS